ncbi:MAG TPA: hypothetical protein VLM79_38745 [Kofleriaceae bacterium]|nr:hypothetical protein [Kofleriaceae bacterium]
MRESNHLAHAGAAFQANQVEDPGQARPRLLVVQPLSRASAPHEIMRRLLFISPLLLLIAAVCALAGQRRPAVARNFLEVTK